MEFIDKLYVVYLNGRPYLRDSSFRTYKTLERAKKETARWSKLGWSVTIVELSLSDVLAVVPE